MQKVRNPIPLFLDITGRLMDGGKIYIGVADGDPQTDPIDTFWDHALTVPATQPIRTVGGQIVNGVSPAAVFVAEDDFSIRILDQLDNLVDYSASNFDGINFQPLDADLTTISGQANTAYGLDLLTSASPTAGAGITLTKDGSGVVTAIAVDGTSVKPYESLIIAASDETTALATGTAKITFRMPYAFTLSAPSGLGIKGSLSTAQTSGSIFTADIKKNGGSILSTLLTLDNGEKTSVTAATPLVVSSASLAADDEITIDITQIGDGTAKGLKVTFIGRRA